MEIINFGGGKGAIGGGKGEEKNEKNALDKKEKFY
jgi:hypothetical protein